MSEREKEREREREKEREQEQDRQRQRQRHTEKETERKRERERKTPPRARTHLALQLVDTAVDRKRQLFNPEHITAKCETGPFHTGHSSSGLPTVRRVA